MSLSRMLSTARSALFAHQWAMNVTANNIANASTPGYSRQRLLMQPNGNGGPGFGGFAGFGGGVQGTDIVRVRDQFLDASYRREEGSLGASTTMRYFLQGVEGTMNEPSEEGVSAALSQLFLAFGDLASDPSGTVSREEVRAAAENLARRLNRMDADLRERMGEAEQRLRSEVAEVNDLTAQIAELNGMIQSATAASGPNPALLDQRDALLDQLAGKLSIEVIQDEGGSVTVTAGGATLVSGGVAQELSVKDLDKGGLGFGPAANDVALEPKGGSLEALSRLAAETLPGFREKLDQLAQALVTEINAIHRTGTGADGSTGVDFFDPDGVTAGSISVSDAVLSSLDAIAAGDADGDNTVARQLAALDQASLDGLGGETFTGFYAGIISSVGRATRDSIQDQTAAQASVAQVDAWRASVSGVSIDEEMVNLISQQEAYTAAARMVSIADQMVQEILRIVS